MARSIWVAIYRCTGCNRRLSESQMMYSDAVCPYCGNSDSGTIVDCHKEVREWVYGPWWRLWTGGYWADEESP